MSVVKVFSFHERFKLCMNADAFNALDGIQQLNTASWPPRKIQV